MKKLCTALAVMMFFLISILPIDASATNADVDLKVNTQLLQSLKIMDNDDFLSNMGNEITRAQFVALCMRIYTESMPVTFENYQYFLDVPATHEYAGYISYAAATGIISGNENGEFRPDEFIQVNEANKMLAVMLGYRVIAEEKGGYPIGYNYVSAMLKLETGGMSAGNQPLLVGEALYKIEKALKAKLMQAAGYSEEGSNHISASDETILDRLEVTKIRGVVTAVYGATLSGKEIKEVNQIAINSEFYVCELENTRDYFANEVEAYIRENDSGKNQILSLEVSSRSNIVTVYSENITEVKGFDKTDSAEDRSAPSVKYYNESNIVKKLHLEQFPVLVWNGEVKQNFGNKTFSVESGTLTFHDFDGDSIYETVIITANDSYVVESVGRKSLSLSGLNSSMSLDETDKTKKITIIKNGKRIPLSEVATGDVVSIARSESGNCICVRISNYAIEGVLSEIDGQYLYMDNGERYMLSPNCKDSYQSGESVKLYLDVDERIAKIERAVMSETYGYIVALEEINAAMERYKLRLATLEEKPRLLDLELAPRVIVVKEGSQKLSPQEVYARFSPGGTPQRQLVKYQLNAQGQLSKIIQAVGYKDEDRFSLDYVNKAAAYYSYNDPLLGTCRYNAKTAKCLVIPADRYLSNERAYSSSISPVQNQTYNIQAYDMDAFNTASIIIFKTDRDFDGLTSPSNVTSRQYPLHIVTGVSKMLDSNGNPAPALRLTSCDGTQKTVPVLEALQSKFHLKYGDVVQYEVNSSGYVSWVNKVYDYQKDIFGTQTKPGYGQYAIGGSLPNPDVLMIYGEVRKLSDTEIMLDVNGEERPFLLNGNTICLTDRQAEIYSRDQIQLGDKVLMRVYRRRIDEIVVIDRDE